MVELDSNQADDRSIDFDAIVIGAGFSGLSMLHEALERGFTVRAFEAASDVGGTWYWNRYPGARTDSESWVYCYSFDDELLAEWEWPERYPAQGDVMRYLRHVAERFDLRRHIEFETRVVSAVFDEEVHAWIVTTDSGRSYRSRYLISACGILSVPIEPPFPGLELFEGEHYLTGRWPHEQPDFFGKRVAVVGTGATGIQIIPVLAEVANRLVVFQRTANYVLPGRNHNLDPYKRRAINSRYDEIWDLVAANPGAMAMKYADRKVADCTPEEQRRILESAWEAGGLQFTMVTFNDFLTNADANFVVSEFVRNKIRSIVKDPQTAELLCPSLDNPIGVKRVPLGHGYYQAFDRENVDLVDVSSNPIADVTARGLRLTDGTEYEVDVIIFALGFDALTGALKAIDLRNAEGQSIADRWSEGVETYLSVCVDGFPNFFMIAGPQAPQTNAVPKIEAGSKWIGEAMSFMREHRYTRMEVTSDQVAGYSKLMWEYLDRTILASAGKRLRSWFLGANVPGKAIAPLHSFGGYQEFLDSLAKEAAGGYPSFEFHAAKARRAEKLA